MRLSEEHSTPHRVMLQDTAANGTVSDLLWSLALGLDRTATRIDPDAACATWPRFGDGSAELRLKRRQRIMLCTRDLDEVSSRATRRDRPLLFVLDDMALILLVVARNLAQVCPAGHI
jgi:hypothetical protein